MASSAAGIGAQSTLRGRGKHFCLPEICWNFTYLPPPQFFAGILGANASCAPVSYPYAPGCVETTYRH